MPKRIQRRRSKGFKLPPNCVYVGRPTKWGNPYRIGNGVGCFITAQGAVDGFRRYIEANQQSADRFRKPLSELRGKDLACWCPLCEKHKNGRPMNEPCSDCPPCHADILLEISNLEIANS